MVVAKGLVDRPNPLAHSILFGGVGDLSPQYGSSQIWYKPINVVMFSLRVCLKSNKYNTLI